MRLGGIGGNLWAQLSSDFQALSNDRGMPSRSAAPGQTDSFEPSPRSARPLNLSGADTNQIRTDLEKVLQDLIKLLQQAGAGAQSVDAGDSSDNPDAEPWARRRSPGGVPSGSPGGSPGGAPGGSPGGASAPVGASADPGPANTAPITNAALKANLDSYKPGDWGGQCVAFVEKVFGLEGRNQEFGLNSVGNGGVAVDGLVRNYGFKPSGAVPGAVFEGNWQGGTGPGHTGIVLQNLGNGKLLVEDSNWAGDERVRIHEINASQVRAFCVKPGTAGA